MDGKKIIGGLCFLFGAVFLMNSFSGITGFVVLENAKADVSSILGIALVIGGLLMFMAGKSRDKYKDDS